MPAELGLRERKKQRTRQLIAETARRLFTERGFERVTVAEIARVAEVSEQTVFNYFPRKEDLVYWRMKSYQDELVTAIRERGSGESVLAAFSRFVRTPRGLLAARDAEAREQLAGLTRMIQESPALLAREHEIFAGYTDTVAALIAEETGAGAREIEPWVAAMCARVRCFLRSRSPGSGIAAVMSRTVATQSLFALESLGHYGNQP